MRIESTYLIAAMFVTVFLLYIFSPEPEIIVKYPDISQKVSDIYVDDQGVCYRYHRIHVDDKTNESEQTIVTLKTK